MQDLGKERVEERVTRVDEVEAMRDEFSLRLKTKDQNKNKDLNYTTLRKRRGYGSDTKIGESGNFHFLDRMPLSEAQMWTSVFIIHRPYFQHPDTQFFWTQDQVYEWFTAPHPAIIENEPTLKPELAQIESDKQKPSLFTSSPPIPSIGPTYHPFASMLSPIRQYVSSNR